VSIARSSRSGTSYVVCDIVKSSGTLTVGAYQGIILTLVWSDVFCLYA